MSIPGSANPLLFASVAAEAAGYQIERSIRLNSSDSAHLSRTPSSAGNRKTWTWAGWVKRSGLTGGADLLFAVYQDSSNRGYIQFQSSTDKILLFKRIGGTDKYEYSTDAVFRDPSAWYHIVVAFDTTQATASNRVKIYVNGVEQSLTTTTTAAQNLDTLFNAAQPHYVGRDGASQYFDGYLAGVHFIDGQALEPTDFGEYDSNNVWQPKEFAGTYGTNGFHLDFSDNSSNAALGDDSSGNNNDWTVNNLVADAPGLSTANQGMDVVTYTGNGSTQSITGLDFQPDFVWLKERGPRTNVSHQLYDVVRGVSQMLQCDNTGAEATISGVSAFNSDGFTLGNNGGGNNSGSTYVAWCWKAGGTASSNTDGTITSSVSANTTYGFSIVSYTGNGTDGATVGHGLNATPGMVIVKRRDVAQNWVVAHSGITLSSQSLSLNLTTNATSFGDGWIDAWDSSTFRTNQGAASIVNVNANTGTYVAYCWSEVSGFSKFSDYNGNGSTQTITTGFKPAWIMFKRYDSSAAGADWYILDTKRVSGTQEYLLSPNSNNGEASTLADYVVLNPDGFLLNTGTTLNGSGRSYIYAAFASKPDGSVIDSLIDTPTNYEADSGNNGGNYCTWNSLKQTSGTYSNGNLQIATSSGNKHYQATFGLTSGKWYWEVTPTAGGTPGMIGIALDSKPLSNNLNGDSGMSYYSVTGNKQGGNTSGVDTSYGASYTYNDVIGVALDLDSATKTITFYKNGSSQGVAFNPDPTLGSWHPAVSAGSSSNTTTFVANFGQRPFAYTPPTGYLSLCTQNLTDPTIADGSTAMDVALYTGNGSTQTISGLNFSPDLAWIKRRDSAGNHALFDQVRGAGKFLISSSTSAEGTDANSLTGFTSDGFSVGQSTTAPTVNGTSQTYVGWAWDGGTSTVSNTDGSITSSVRANASAGFSIVTYTGAGSGSSTIGHGLNAAPELIVLKFRGGTSNWSVYHSAIGNTKRLVLNSTGSTQTSSTYWNNTSPTSSVFSVGGDLNDSTTIVAYCFAPVDGYSSFGSYTGNGSATDGPFVYTGHRSRWLMVKRTDSTGNWVILDTARNPYNPSDTSLYADDSFQDYTPAQGWADILSNGFKPHATYAEINASGGTYIYVSFAESPFQYARAR